jgi:hypothetical protein
MLCGTGAVSAEVLTSVHSQTGIPFLLHAAYAPPHVLKSVMIAARSVRVPPDRVMLYGQHTFVAFLIETILAGNDEHAASLVKRAWQENLTEALNLPIPKKGADEKKSKSSVLALAVQKRLPCTVKALLTLCPVVNLGMGPWRVGERVQITMDGRTYPATVQTIHALRDGYFQPCLYLGQNVERLTLLFTNANIGTYYAGDVVRLESPLHDIWCKLNDPTTLQNAVERAIGFMLANASQEQHNYAALVKQKVIDFSGILLPKDIMAIVSMCLPS